MNVKSKVKLMLVGLAVVLAYAFPASAQDKPADNKWEFHVIPYFWLASLDGDVTVKGIKSSVSLSGSDLLDMLDYGGEVHMEAWKGRWGFFFDPTYLKLSSDGHANTRVGRIDVDVDLKEWLIEFGGLYTLSSVPLGTNGKKLSLDLLGGGRLCWV